MFPGVAPVDPAGKEITFISSNDPRVRVRARLAARLAAQCGALGCRGLAASRRGMAADTEQEEPVELDIEIWPSWIVARAIGSH